MFVSWCFNEAGLVSLVAASSKKGFASCTAGLSWFQKHKRVVNKYAGQPGDIVFFNFNGDGTPDHVGIIEAASKDGLTVIEGNTSPDFRRGSQVNGDGVYRRHRPYLNVMAIVRPNYPVSVKPATSLSQNKKIATGVAGATALGGGGAAVVNTTSSDTVKPTTYVSAPAFPGTGSFKIGSENKAVLAVENGLVKVKLLTLADGIYTSKTKAAVVAYQKRKGLVADGIVGPKTYSSIVKEVSR
jgi:peptidoglycan hydrolase-like protein with peptidoglycan-binding domain